jgi:hypothetical protein
MRNRFHVARPLSAALMAAIAGTAGAQNAPGVHQDNSGMNGSLSRGDLQKLGGDHPDSDTAGSITQSHAKTLAQAIELVKALDLSCEVNDARLVIAGTRRPASGGKAVNTRVYEVTCGGATGYLLESQGADKPLGISCMSAEEARAADVAKGKQPGFFCTLPGNKDVYAAVAGLIEAGAGSRCTVSALQLFGRGETSRTEYNEVACKEGSGFLLRTALPGSGAATTVMSCAEAAKQGIKCRLTDAGPVEAPVTMDTFKGALAQHGVACNIGQIRMIGQEDHLKRYVVEYRCVDDPAAWVAFIPLQGNTNPYEAMDCAAAAAEHGVSCKFTQANR